MGILEGKYILVTSGPMRGYIDAVRYISNKSTGRLGALIGRELLKNGANVTFLYGAGSVVPDVAFLEEDCARRLNLVEIETFDDLLTVLQERLKNKRFDSIVHAMAVLDYVPEWRDNRKISSDKEKLIVTFLKTPKVIKLLKELWPYAFLIGFKLETGLSKDELVERAYVSLKESSADLVVANNQDEIAGEKHRAYFINARKEIECTCNTKEDIARNLTDTISRHIAIKN